MATDPNSVRATIVSAIQNYLDVIHGRHGSRLIDLALALDRLVATYYATPEVDPDTLENEAPRVEERPIIDAIAAAFPEIGEYALAWPDDEVGSDVSFSDAACDLAEIAADLMEVLWYFDAGRYDHAIWEYSFGYRSHWGTHVHQVRPYLHRLAAW